MIGAIISAVIVGAVIGVLGRLALPGKQDISVLMTIGVGVAAAVIGTLVADGLGVGDTNGVDWIKLVIQVALAAVGVSLAATLVARRA